MSTCKCKFSANVAKYRTKQVNFHFFCFLLLLNCWDATASSSLASGPRPPGSGTAPSHRHIVYFIINNLKLFCKTKHCFWLDIAVTRCFLLILIGVLNRYIPFKCNDPQTSCEWSWRRICSMRDAFPRIYQIVCLLDFVNRLRILIWLTDYWFLLLPPPTCSVISLSFHPSIRLPLIRSSLPYTLLGPDRRGCRYNVTSELLMEPSSGPSPPPPLGWYLCPLSSHFILPPFFLRSSSLSSLSSTSSRPCTKKRKLSFGSLLIGVILVLLSSADQSVHRKCVFLIY